MKEKSLKYWDAFTTGYIEGILFQTFEIEEEKNLVFWTSKHKDGWALNFEWTVGYEAGAIGTWDSPPEDNEDVNDNQTYYFNLDENPIKVKKEILLLLEEISDLPSPEDNEIERDEPDYE